MIMGTVKMAVAVFYDHVESPENYILGFKQLKEVT